MSARRNEGLSRVRTCPCYARRSARVTISICSVYGNADVIDEQAPGASFLFFCLRSIGFRSRPLDGEDARAAHTVLVEGGLFGCEEIGVRMIIFLSIALTIGIRFRNHEDCLTEKRYGRRIAPVIFTFLLYIFVKSGGLVDGKDARGEFHGVVDARGHAAAGARRHHGGVPLRKVGNSDSEFWSRQVTDAERNGYPSTCVYYHTK